MKARAYQLEIVGEGGGHAGNRERERMDAAKREDRADGLSRTI